MRSLPEKLRKILDEHPSNHNSLNMIQERMLRMLLAMLSRSHQSQTIRISPWSSLRQTQCMVNGVSPSLLNLRKP